MTKREMVQDISRDTGIPFEDVYAIVQQTLDKITDALVAGDHIEFRNFGVFEVRTRKQRIGRNPKKPDHEVVIPETRVVKFKPGKKMAARVRRS